MAEKIKIERWRSFVPGLVFLILFSFKLSAYADILYLKNGRNIEGIIKKEDGQDIFLDVGSGVMKFSKDQIHLIHRSAAEDAQLIRQRWAREKVASEASFKEIRQRLEQAPKQVIVDKQNGHLTVEAILNNKVKVNLMLDTGSSLVILSSKVAASLGIDVSIKTHKTGDLVELILADGRKVKARRIILDSVNVQGSEVRKVEAAVSPAQEDSSVLSRDGLLGMSFLKNFNFKIDQQNNNLILEELK